MARTDERAARYQMGPRSTRGLVAGWRSSQIAFVAIGLVLAVGVLRSVSGLEGGALALGIVGGAVAAATWPIRGRSIEQWAPTAVTFAVRAVAEGRYRPWRSARSSSRSPMSRLNVLPLAESGIGVISDAEAGTWSAVVPVGGAGFALLDDTERASRIAAWSGALAAMARSGGGLHRIQWIVRAYPSYLGTSLPGTGPAPGDWPAPMGESTESYAQLIREVAPSLWSHEVLVAVTVKAGPRSFAKAAGKSRRRGTEIAAPLNRQPELAPAGGDAGTDDRPDRLLVPSPRPTVPARGRHYRRLPEAGADDCSSDDPVAGSEDEGDARLFWEQGSSAVPAVPAAPAVRAAPVAPAVSRGSGPPPDEQPPRRRGQDPAQLLQRHLASLAERLEGAGLRAGPPLSPPQLVGALRRSFEVSPLREIETWPWPVGTAESWTRLRTDATWQAVYWIAEWPRGAVGTTFMLPLLLSAGIRRTVSVTMAPLPPLAAVRRAERERTSGSADAELRQRHGFAVSARARREQESRLQREGELAEGHAGYLYSGYVTVTGHDVEDLEQACARIEQDAALAQLELRRLYGAQEEAFCCTLPIGRGCR